MWTFLTDNKTGIELLVNMGMVERVEGRSRGSALYYTYRRRPVRVTESLHEISKRLSVPKRRK